MDTDCITLCRAEHCANLPDYCTLCNAHRPLQFIDIDTIALGTSLTDILENYVKLNVVLSEWILRKG